MLHTSESRSCRLEYGFRLCFGSRNAAAHFICNCLLIWRTAVIKKLPRSLKENKYCFHFIMLGVQLWWMSLRASLLRLLLLLLLLWLDVSTVAGRYHVQKIINHIVLCLCVLLLLWWLLWLLRLWNDGWNDFIHFRRKFLHLNATKMSNLLPPSLALPSVFDWGRCLSLLRSLLHWHIHFSRQEPT